MKKSLLVLISICSLGFLNGCGGGGSSGPTQDVATHFSVTSANATPTAGTPFNLTVTALDASGQMVTSYSGTVHFTSSNGQPVQPASETLTGGTGTFSVTLNTAGPQTITATDTASLTGTSASITVTAPPSPVPLINQPLSPAAVVPGGAAFKLTVNGTGFVSGSMVKWNGSARATSFVSESQLTATVLASDIASFNTASVTVVNPAPGGGTSNVAFFETTRPTSAVAGSITSALATGTGPSSVATADFNGDGKLDVVLTNGGSNNISIFLGNGDGTFQAAVNYPAGTNPDSVAVGDFNGDGKLDLAVANGGSNNVSVFLGKGDGTFQAAVNYAVGTGPAALAVGDFDGDGELDLAVANSGSQNVSVLLGNGDGTFQTAVDYGAGSSPSSVGVGDFNGDGKLDLAVANGGSNNVSVLLGNGNGTFKAAVDYPTGSNSSSVAVGDFNGDGKLDLAVANPGLGNFTDGIVSILLGNGDGTFQAAVNYPTGSTNSSSVAVGDFNGDGKLDLAVPNADIGENFIAGSVSILLGNGDGTFQPEVSYAAGSNPSSVAVGDFNGDGRLDMVVADLTNSTASVLLQPGLVSGPNASLSSTSLNFATQLVGTISPAQSVMLTNYGTATLNITGIAATTNFGETDNCGLSVAAGTSCTISVTFAPGAVDNLAGTLSITDNAPGSPQTVSLNGVGTVVTLVPDSIGFNCTATCQSKTTTLTNTGATTLSITSITITSNKPPGVGAHVGFAQTNNCATSLGAGQSCSITVSFVGDFEFQYIGALLVNDNGGGSPQTVSLSGFLTP
jgi:hypothetical protein